MEIQGEVKDIIFHNDINSYTIAVFETDEEEITMVGCLPFINCGDTLKLIGKYVNHQDYGRQFKVETFEKLLPQTTESLERYLANGIIKGIGPAIAKKIVKEFGEETILVFKFEPKKLSRIKGITPVKAIEMADEFNQNWEVWQIVGFLEKFGIGVQNSKNVYKKFGGNAISEIEANPYVLLDVANNVEFKHIDKMALELGIQYNDIKRIKSGIKYALMSVTTNGHCAVIEENLYQFVKELLGVEKREIETAIIELKVKEEIIVEEYENEKWVYLYHYYKAEKNVAEKLMILKNSKNSKEIHNISKEIKKVEIETGIELSPRQNEAIKIVNENNVCIITGGPGTGKTTIIKVIIELYKKHGKKPVLCAPTGRAAKRMTETTGEEAKTLHRLLEIGKFEDESSKPNMDMEVAPLDADVVIVDEMSMVDLFLMNYLLKAIYKGTKIVFVGDIDQLPSVGPGSILGDLIKSEKLPTITLDKIFRQAAQSKIIINSHRVNKGNSFLLKENENIDEEIKNVIETDSEKIEQLNDDFFFIKETNQDKILEQVISLCNGRLEKFGNYNFFKNIQVITPTKKGLLGTRELNVILQNTLNPHKNSESEKQVYGNTFRVGDKVMQIKNNYDIFWKKTEPINETGTGVFNGELGIIKGIDNIEKVIEIKFDDGKTVWYQFSDLEQIEHSYAITVHKAQGSEFDVVIMPISPSAPMLLTRNLLYTGMTRAKKLLIVIGYPKIVEFMINNADNKKRNTGLAEKLKKI
ncbi:MAG TPA: ATP-dependent RecD-like DNA helicase [Clostridia bacterium]|nr:ATP-dependent RecD-like DNA helicase [Clostridia bacterium]